MEHPWESDAVWEPEEDADAWQSQAPLAADIIASIKASLAEAAGYLDDPLPTFGWPLDDAGPMFDMALDQCGADGDRWFRLRPRWVSDRD